MASAKCSEALLRRLNVRGVWSQARKMATDAKSIAELRKEYSNFALSENDPIVKQGPFKLFDAWLNEARSAKTTEPNAMCLSTCVDNRPSARYVLLKAFDERGFAWYTNYESDKGRQLTANPQAALTFWWGELERQVRVEGRVERVSSEDSDKYFSIRPRGSQLGAWSSQQSRPVADRAALEQQEQEVTARFDANQPVPRPDHWGGFRLVPDKIEFWKGRGSRLHDRLVFVRQGDEWILSRLQP